MRQSGLFLIELIIVILFFSISAAICMRIFAVSKIASDNANQLNSAVEASQNAAECFKSSNGSFDRAVGLLGAELTDKNTAVLALQNGLILTMTVNETKSTAYSSLCDIAVHDSEGAEVFTITAAALTD